MSMCRSLAGVARKLFGTAKHLLPKDVWLISHSEEIQNEIRNSVVYCKKSHPFSSDFFSNVGMDARRAFESLAGWQQIESMSILRRRAFIEPRQGWIVSDPFHLVNDCLIDASFVGRPSFGDYIKSRYLRAKQILKMAEVISLRDSGEANYWHFLNDLLGGRLGLAECFGLNHRIPILISRRLFTSQFFQEALGRSEALGKRNYIIQDDRLIESSCTYYFQTNRHSIDNIFRARSFLNVPASIARGDRRVFLYRGKAVGRTISNSRDIFRICDAYSFVPIDAAALGLDEQIHLFSSIRFLVGIHGAGLASIAFRACAPMSLLEIFPPANTQSFEAPPPHYFWMATQLGFEYDFLFGESRRDRGNCQTSFSVDVRVFREKLEAMII